MANRFAASAERCFHLAHITWRECGDRSDTSSVEGGTVSATVSSVQSALAAFDALDDRQRDRPVLLAPLLNVRTALAVLYLLTGEERQREAATLADRTGRLGETSHSQDDLATVTIALPLESLVQYYGLCRQSLLHLFRLLDMHLSRLAGASGTLLLTLLSVAIFVGGSSIPACQWRVSMIPWGAVDLVKVGGKWTMSSSPDCTRWRESRVGCTLGPLPPQPKLPLWLGHVLTVWTAYRRQAGVPSTRRRFIRTLVSLCSRRQRSAQSVGLSVSLSLRPSVFVPLSPSCPTTIEWADDEESESGDREADTEEDGDGEWHRVDQEVSSPGALGKAGRGSDSGEASVDEADAKVVVGEEADGAAMSASPSSAVGALALARRTKSERLPTAATRENRDRHGQRRSAVELRERERVDGQHGSGRRGVRRSHSDRPRAKPRASSHHHHHHKRQASAHSPSHTPPFVRQSVSFSPGSPDELQGHASPPPFGQRPMPVPPPSSPSPSPALAATSAIYTPGGFISQTPSGEGEVGWDGERDADGGPPALLARQASLPISPEPRRPSSRTPSLLDRERERDAVAGAEVDRREADRAKGASTTERDREASRGGARVQGRPLGHSGADSEDTSLSDHPTQATSATLAAQTLAISPSVLLQSFMPVAIGQHHTSVSVDKGQRRSVRRSDLAISSSPKHTSFSLSLATHHCTVCLGCASGRAVGGVARALDRALTGKKEEETRPPTSLAASPANATPPIASPLSSSPPFASSSCPSLAAVAGAATRAVTAASTAGGSALLGGVLVQEAASGAGDSVDRWLFTWASRGNVRVYRGRADRTTDGWLWSELRPPCALLERGDVLFVATMSALGHLDPLVCGDTPLVAAGLLAPTADHHLAPTTTRPLIDWPDLVRTKATEIRRMGVARRLPRSGSIHEVVQQVVAGASSTQSPRTDLDAAQQAGGVPGATLDNGWFVFAVRIGQFAPESDGEEGEA